MLQPKCYTTFCYEIMLQAKNVTCHFVTKNVTTKIYYLFKYATDAILSMLINNTAYI